MTLTEFLLARIAEDEVAQRDSQRAWHVSTCDAVSSELVQPCTCGLPARVLADCDAKRRIIEQMAELRAEVERLASAWESNEEGYGIPSPSWAFVAGALRTVLGEHA